MSKKKIIIIVLVVVILAIICGVFIFINKNTDSNNAEADLEWVKSYVQVIANVLDSESEDFYFVEGDIDNLKLEIIKNENYEYPFIILEYTENYNEVIYNGYEIFYMVDSEVEHYGLSYSGNTTLAYLHNISEDTYGWYFYSTYEDLILVESLDQVINGESFTDSFGSETQFNEVYTKIDDISSYSSISTNFDIDENELNTNLHDLAIDFVESNENTLKLKNN